MNAGRRLFFHYKNFRRYVSYVIVNAQHRYLSHFRKMDRDSSDVIEQQKKQKSVTSSWVPKSFQSSANEVTTGNSAGSSVSSFHFVGNDFQCEVSDTKVSFSSSNETGAAFRYESSSVEVERHAASIEVDASLLRFIKGKGGATQRRIEEETGVKIILPSSRGRTTVVIEGPSIENVKKAATKINGAVEEGIRSPLLDYSHFVSLPLAIHPQLVEKLNDFQNSIVGASGPGKDRNMEVDPENYASADGNDNETLFEDVELTLAIDRDEEHVKVERDSGAIKKTSTRSNSSVLSDLGIDRSIFIKPKTFHLTVLMLKLWNKELVAAAADVLQKISPKVLEALDNRPLSIRLKGLECMKGSPARARVLYAPIEELGGEGRLMRACEVIIEAYIQAGLVLEKDARQTLKLHATLMNVRHRKRNKTRGRREESFDARGIFRRYGSEDWGEYLVKEAHLSQRFLFGESGYYHCCGSLPFPSPLTPQPADSS
ncbi:unnamed protein product [Spirodela intermedia]|uniref:K Homology domain-containing protein n=1 Tax=Spirodela intermedia TaxID=51605 RepID=A0A7I8KYD9_SPIIN|nr:unnamed protein product [Spirodela intermedia]